MQNYSEINAAGGSGSCATGKQDTDIAKIVQNDSNINEKSTENEIVHESFKKNGA